MQFIDTTILLYAVSRSPEEARKKDVAHSVLDQDDCALSVQVMMEFYAQATRPTRLGALSHEQAAGMINAWRRFPVQAQTEEIFAEALRIKAKTKFSIWDSSIIAAALALGCETLLTEDMKHGQVIEGVRMVNPFG